MKKFGFRIGDTGVEFPSIEDREKAIRVFTKSSTVKISNIGIRYKDSEGSFAVYDRDTKEVITNCVSCEGQFYVDSCGKREYPEKYSYSNDYHEENAYICDACYAKKIKAKEIFDARQIVKKAEEDAI